MQHVTNEAENSKKHPKAQKMHERVPRVAWNQNANNQRTTVSLTVAGHRDLLSALPNVIFARSETGALRSLSE